MAPSLLKAPGLWKASNGSNDGNELVEGSIDDDGTWLVEGSNDGFNDGTKLVDGTWLVKGSNDGSKLTLGELGAHSASTDIRELIFGE